MTGDNDLFNTDDLRDFGRFNNLDVCVRSADEIDRLRQRIAALEKALMISEEMHNCCADDIIQLRAKISRFKELITDCQDDLAEWIEPDSGISDHDVLNTLLGRLDGTQARAALSGKE